MLRKCLQNTDEPSPTNNHHPSDCHAYIVNMTTQKRPSCFAGHFTYSHICFFYKYDACSCISDGLFPAASSG